MDNGKSRQAQSGEKQPPSVWELAGVFLVTLAFAWFTFHWAVAGASHESFRYFGAILVLALAPMIFVRARRHRRLAVTATCIMTAIFFFGLLLYPAIKAALDKEDRSRCSSHLDQIGHAMEDYRQDHGCLPTSGMPGDSDGSLALLYPKYVARVDIFRCPLDTAEDETRLHTSGKWSHNERVWCSYFYDNTLFNAPLSHSLALAWDERPHGPAGRTDRHALNGSYNVEHQADDVELFIAITKGKPVPALPEERRTGAEARPQ
jgi:hypothetical protein